MLRSDKWWQREIERMQREHNTQVLALVETISRLAGKPAPAPVTPDPEPAPRTWTHAPEQQPTT